MFCHVPHAPGSSWRTAASAHLQSSPRWHCLTSSEPATPRRSCSSPPLSATPSPGAHRLGFTDHSVSQRGHGFFRSHSTPSHFLQCNREALARLLCTSSSAAGSERDRHHGVSLLPQPGARRAGCEGRCTPDRPLGARAAQAALRSAMSHTWRRAARSGRTARPGGQGESSVGTPPIVRVTTDHRPCPPLRGKSP